MIKLVACDIDGTLLNTGENEISHRVLEQIERLQRQGVIFCAASGRQYYSLRRLFAPFEDKMYYICNNGSIVYGPYTGGSISKDVLSKTALPRQAAEEVCRHILSKDYFELVVGGESTEYIIPKSYDLSEHLSTIGYNFAKVETIENIPGDMLKVTAFCPDGADSRIDEMKGIWDDDYKVSVSGKRWIDVTLSDKGTGISQLCKELNISLADVLAVGDNYNDLPMLDIVGYPVVMESAALEIKSRVATTCKSVEELLAQFN